MENQLITFGRYKNKTFKEVYNNDKEYCRLILQNHAAYRGDTDQFRKFLQNKFIDNSHIHSRNELNLSRRYLKFMFPELNIIENLSNLHEASKKPSDIDKQSLIPKIESSMVTAFLQYFNDDHLILFYNLVGEHPINYRKLHESSNILVTNGHLGMFYGFFFRKYLWNLKNEDADDSRCKRTVTIFPIHLIFKYEKYQHIYLPIMRHFDHIIFNYVNNYLAQYYLKQENIEREIFHLFRLISIQEEICELSILLNEDFLFFCENNYLELLKNVMFFYCFCQINKCNRVCSFSDWDNSDSDSDSSSSFSIDLMPDTSWFDDVLKYAQSFRRYVKYRGDIMDIIEDIYNLAHMQTVFFGGNYNFEFSRNIIDENALRHIMTYIDNIDNINECKLSASPGMDKFIYDIEDQNVNDDDCILFKKLKVKLDGCYLNGDCDLLVNDTIIDITYSKSRKNVIIDFYKLILYGILIPNTCTKLVIYNAYRGEETSMDMIENTEEIKKFIRRYKDPQYTGNCLIEKIFLKVLLKRRINV